MIVVDLDGTLLNSNMQVSPESKEYLKNLKEQGVNIVIATGRNYASAMYVTDNAEFASHIISDTGACAYDVRNNEAIFENTINKQIALELLNEFNDNYIHISLNQKDIIYEYTQEKFTRSFVIPTMDKNYILENCNNITHMSISLKTNEMGIELYNKLLKRYPDLNIIIMQDSFASNIWIEIMPKGCSKYSGIEKLAKYLNINTDEIISFGDGLNDIEMLGKCSYGVALANALPEVKKVAKDVTKLDNNHDGVINYLKENIYAH